MTAATNGPGREPCRASVDVVQTLPVPDDAIQVQCVCCRQTHYIAPALRSLLRAPITGPGQFGPCHCPPDECKAPVIMGRQTPCLRAAPPAAPPEDAADAHTHKSDCAVHNAPALPIGPCDCGVGLTQRLRRIAAQTQYANTARALTDAAALIEQQARELAAARAVIAAADAMRNMVEMSYQCPEGTYERKRLNDYDAAREAGK